MVVRWCVKALNWSEESIPADRCSGRPCRDTAGSARSDGFPEGAFPEGIPPRRQAFADARSFIRELPERMTLQPVLKLMPNGEIRFTWSADGPPEIYVQIAFHGCPTGDRTSPRRMGGLTTAAQRSRLTKGCPDTSTITLERGHECARQLMLRWLAREAKSAKEAGAGIEFPAAPARARPDRRSCSGGRRVHRQSSTSAPSLTSGGHPRSYTSWCGRIESKSAKVACGPRSR